MEVIGQDMVMRREDRAKQFMPFDAMKGLKEALRDREERHSRSEKRELSEEAKERNNRILQRLERGMTVSVLCYHAFHEVTKEGRVTEINYSAGYLMLGDKKIYFDDIYQIYICDRA